MKMLTNGLFSKLLGSPDFRSRAKLRWSELRNNTLSIASLKHLFRENYNYLASHGVYNREAMVSGLTFNYSETEIDFIESWIERRVNFLDIYFNSM